MTYRVGNHQPRNLYRGNEYIGVCFDPADAALIVDALEGRATAERPWECKLVREHNPETDPCDCRVSQFCALGHSIDDAPSARASLPESAEQAPVGGTGGSEGAQAISGRFEILADITADGTFVTLACRCGWTLDLVDPIDLAELNRRADAHTEECR